MDKIQLMVLGLSASPASNNAYALILKEVDGNRRLPIIIGAFEAQAIALEMEGVVPPRPMTHDLLKNMIDSFGSGLSEVYINELREGTFYARLIFDTTDKEIDARPSDAIALAVRCGAPIYVEESILEETGLAAESEMEEPGLEGGEEDETLEYLKRQQEKQEEPEKPKSRVDHLQTQLDKAINEEDYERAADLRDEIKRLLESS
ncbi:MAG: bifunctional nuclease domain-containing protein [Candidatus Kapaibacterium sp.]